MIGNGCADGRGKGKAVPGAEGQRQPWECGEAANEREIVQAVYLQAAPGAGELEIGNYTSQASDQFPCWLASRWVRSGHPG